MVIHKFEIIVCDPNMEDADAEEFKTDIENSMDRIVHFVSTTTKDDGKEWYDNHPLNFGAQKANNYFTKLSSKNKDVC